MSGTFASYQGFPCVDVRHVVERGVAADRTVVLILASTLLSLERPEGPISRPSTVAKVSLDPITKDAPGVPVPLSSLTNLKAEGSLVLAENVEGETWAFRKDALFVEAAELVRDGSGVGYFRLVLVDERFFYFRGCMPRWSFNRKTAGGEVAADSLNPDGSRVSLTQILVEHLAPNLGPRGVKLAHVPEDFIRNTVERSFPPFVKSVDAIRGIVDETGIEDVCFRHDRTIALHEAGDGAVRAAKVTSDGTPSGANVIEIPEKLRLSKDGTATTKRLELGWPEDVCLVVGGTRIATVALDHWQPVLVYKGRVLRLNEDTVRRLTLNKYGLEWLARFVVLPPQLQNTRGVEREILDLLREQAWKCFRMPGAVLYDAQGDTRPGPNAHLLPMLLRAEEEGGRRAAIMVETFRITTVHKEFDDKSEEDLELSAARGELSLVKEQVVKGSIATGKTDPFRANAKHPIASLGVGLTTITKNISGKTWEGIRGLVTNEILATEIDAKLGAAYGAAEKKLLAAQDKVNATLEADLYDIVKDSIEVAQLEKAKGDQGLIKAKRDLIEGRIKRLDERWSDVAKKRAEATAAGAKTKKHLPGVYYVNEPRTPDPHARVAFREDLGIVQTRDLAGHLETPRVHDASQTRFVPMPVRVQFGAEVRPRRDLPPGQKGKQATTSGLAPAEIAALGLGSPGDVVPKCLTDQASVFVAPFRRVSRGIAASVPLLESGEVPPEVLRSATRIYRPDLVELVPIDGPGTLTKIRQEALDIAKQIFRRPDVIASTGHTFARPWAINPDGVVRRVEIRMRHENVDGHLVPCGFETIVTTGSTAIRVPNRSGTQERPPRDSAGGGRESLRP